MYSTALDIVSEALNTPIEKDKILITGPAGTGKSYLLRSLYERLSECYDVCKIALTHTAAKNIDGETIHSAFAVNPAVNIPNRTPKADVIMIDECSMIHVNLFNRIWPMIESKLVIMFGDFCQLCPIHEDDETISIKDLQLALPDEALSREDVIEHVLFYRSSKSYLFFSPHFNEFSVHLLTGAHRLTGPLLKMADMVRRGAFTEVTLSLSTSFHINATTVCLGATYRVLDKLWQSYLDSANISYTPVPTAREPGESFYENLLIYAAMPVKIIDGPLKGQAAIIVRLDEDGLHVRCDDACGDNHGDDNGGNYTLTKMHMENHGVNYPIIPARFLTVHHAQGLEFDDVLVCIDNMFEPGHLYTAITRCKGRLQVMTFKQNPPLARMRSSIRRMNDHITRHLIGRNGFIRTSKCPTGSP